MRCVTYLGNCCPHCGPCAAVGLHPAVSTRQTSSRCKTRQLLQWQKRRVAHAYDSFTPLVVCHMTSLCTHTTHTPPYCCTLLYCTVIYTTVMYSLYCTALTIMYCLFILTMVSPVPAQVVSAARCAPTSLQPQAQGGCHCQPVKPQPHDDGVLSMLL